MNYSALVAELLDDRTYHIEFNGHLTNHAKHAVVAFAGLGAPDTRIKEYYENYAKLTPYGFGLEPARPATHVVSAADWTDHLGKRTSFSAYCEFFDRMEKELGLDEVLRRYLPTLLAGWVGSFTHAVIHLGWALDAGSRWMAVEGLAYLAFSYVSCHPERSGPAGPGGDPVRSLLHVAGAWEGERDRFESWVRSVIADTESASAQQVHPELARSGLQFRISRLLAEGHPTFYETPAGSAADWDRLYYVVTLLYLSAPGDFILLHLITSLYAMEKIAERLPADLRAYVVKCFWIGMFSVILSEGNVPSLAALTDLHATYDTAVDADATAAAADWAGIVARAIEEEEEHNPKLVFVLRQIWRRSGGRSIYRAAAAGFTTTPQLPPSFDEPPTE